ncbi:MAG: hypothetical protein IOD12_05265 [Silvanigrellales bacterium]|jgi:hypothetical protein|nr:hypothetical protein [Silvanigrellales bacterium]
MRSSRSSWSVVAVSACVVSPAPFVWCAPAFAQSLEPTVASLDAAWEKRAALHSSLVAFLKSKPRVGDDFEVLWRMSRLAYYAGFFALPGDVRKEEKLEVFKVGSESGEKARRLNPARVEGHYWYAISVGGLGIAKGVMASLGSASDMRSALDEAVKIDPKYHFAGPLRVRGRLFYKLPGGFLSFGDNKKALADLRKALEFGPESKLNYAYLAEVVDAVDGSTSALKILETAKKLPDVAGEAEEASYRRDIADLERRLK